MRCFKIFGIDEQYRSKFRMIQIKMLKKIIIHFLFPLYDFFLLSFFFLLSSPPHPFIFLLLSLSLSLSLQVSLDEDSPLTLSLSLFLPLPQIFSLSLPWRSVVVIVIVGRGDNSYSRVGFVSCQLMSIRLYELILTRHAY